MANACSGDMIQKNSSILVKVEEALTDLIVVSYIIENKKFEGVLLETHKSDLPYGVYNLHPAFTNAKTASESKDDTLFSVSQRFTYQDDPASNADQHAGKKLVPKAKPQKMTVRLRPRKVLCSNCKGICNENNENVDLSRKRKPVGDFPADDSADNEGKKKFLMKNSLIPKLSRLDPHEISNAIKGSSKGKANKASDKTLIIDKDEDDRVGKELTFVDVADNSEKALHSDMKTDKNESYKDQGDKEFNTVYSNARTLKICFGEGEGTVVKIPATVGDYNDDSGVSCDMSTKQGDKAVKKALKRAKRQKKKDTQLGKTLSPKHIGALSPRNNSADNTPNFNDMLQKKKRKLKHKRKCKPKMEEGDENTSKTVESESINYFSGIKKLSISLRRLSSNAYEKCEEDSNGWDSEIVPEFPASSNEGIGNKPLQVSVGDVVWGKVVGFPWWPGRVLKLSSASHAHVAWYASTLSSLMPCDNLSPFLDEYKLRFNKKNKGLYKEAVKLATLEANKCECSDPLASPTLPTMSPRPINVFS